MTIKIANIVKEVQDYFLINHFKKIKPNTFEREINNFVQIIQLTKSNIDDSYYIEAYIDYSKVDELKNIDDTKIGGRVSKDSVDFLGGSWVAKDTEKAVEQIKSIFEKVINPWFGVFNTPESYFIAFDIGYREKRVVKPNEKLPYNPQSFIQNYQQFINTMESLGFHYYFQYDAIIFYRKKEHLYDIFMIEITGGGVFLSVRVATWMPEIQVFDDDKSLKPNSYDSLLLLNGGFINSGEIRNRPEKCITVLDIEDTASLLTSLLESCAGVFYESIKTKVDFLDSIEPEHKKNSYFKDVLNTFVNECANPL